MIGQTWKSCAPCVAAAVLASILLVLALGCGGGAASPSPASSAPPPAAIPGTGGTGTTGGPPPPPPPPPPPSSSRAVTMWKYNEARTGLNDQEPQLTVKSVSGGAFGRLFSYQLDGEVFAQPLYVSDLNIGGKTRNVVFFATEH